MTKWIAVVCLPALCFYVVSLAQPVLATPPWTGMPHTFAYKLEPESVSVGSTVKITGTLIPCVDVESLVVYLRLPKASGAEVSLPLVREWRGEGKKGKAINISGDVVFQKPGTYRFSISYSHPHPRYRKSMVWDYRSFIIRVPGGIQTPKAQAESFGEEAGTPGNKVIKLRHPPADTAWRGNLEFTGQVTFETVDADSSGLAEALAVDAEVRVLEAGQYVIAGSLSRQGEFITLMPRLRFGLRTRDLIDGPPGTYVAHLEFSGEDIFAHGVNGPYTVELQAFDSTGVQDTLRCSTPSCDYTIFGEVMATLTSATDSGVDLDSDGKYDVLRTTLHASVRVPGTFAVSGGLSKDSVSIVDSGVNVPLQTGDQIVNLDFPGIKIRKKNIDGPYNVSVCIRDTVAYNSSCMRDTTGIYSASEFDVSALTPTGNHDDQGLDLDQDGAYDVLRASFEVNSKVSGPGARSLFGYSVRYLDRDTLPPSRLAQYREFNVV